MIETTLSKGDFLLILKVNPLLLIDKLITYGGRSYRILDVSLGGDHFLIEIPSTARSWVLANGVGDPVVIEDYPLRSTKFTASSLNSSIETLYKLLGQPGSEQTKCLFEIVEALNKEMLELKFKIEEIQSKE